MYPLISILVLVIIAGILIGGIAILFRRTRSLAPYFVLCPLLAAVVAIALLWGGGLLTAHLFGVGRWSSIASFLGYFGGLVLGAYGGFRLARSINARSYR